MIDYKTDCRIVGHSIDQFGNELVSAELTYPLIVHAELMAHRMFTKNGASARAIPGNAYRDAVSVRPMIPFGYQKTHPGMQGSEYISEEVSKYITDMWVKMSQEAVHNSIYLEKTYDLTKQLTNRLLSPFAWIKVLVTTGRSGLDNFFHLRCHPDAEIHMQDLAYNWKKHFSLSTPRILGGGDWHIPYHTEINLALDSSEKSSSPIFENKITELMVKVSVGKTGRVSYTLLPESRDYEKELELHDRMFVMDPFHASPFEHCAQCMTTEEYYTYGHLLGLDDKGDQIIEYGHLKNYRGFKSYRYLIEKNK